MGYKKIKYVFDPIGDVKVVNQKAVLNEIADFVRDEILASVADGKSPVQGEGTFKRLSKKYSDKEKGGDRSPNLDLNGDMLDGLTVKVKGDMIEVSVDDDAGKVEGHNQFDSGLNHPLPRRRFIPDDNQTFVRGMTSEIKAMVLENEAAEPMGGVESTFTSQAKERSQIKNSVSEILKGFGFSNVDDEGT